MYSCGDYEYQCILLEIMIRMNNEHMIITNAKQWFPEESLHQALIEITEENIDSKSRNFLNVLNFISNTVLSIEAKHVYLDSFCVVPFKVSQCIKIFNLNLKVYVFICFLDQSGYNDAICT